MKTAKIFLAVIFSLVVLSSFAFAGGGEVYTRNGDNVIVWKPAEIYSGVPKGIPNDIAAQMMRGDIRKPYVLPVGIKIRFIMSYLLLQAENFEDAWTYQEGQWKSEKTSEIKTGWGATGAFMTIIFFLPLLLCWLVSLFNQTEELGTKRLLLFYLCLAGSVPLGAYLGSFYGTLVAVMLVTFSSWFAGGIYGIVAGLFLGSTVGVVSTGPTLYSDEKIFIYTPIVAAICLISFLAAKGIRKLSLAYRDRLMLKHPRT